jgi:hypothetical protein
MRQSGPQAAARSGDYDVNGRLNFQYDYWPTVAQPGREANLAPIKLRCGNSFIRCDVCYSDFS